MLSVCIPVFNTDITCLVHELVQQSEELKIPVEIVIIDDASDVEFREINEKVKSTVKYISLDTNLGRSKIRNFFLKYAQYDFLLFMDGDSIIISENFLSDYIISIKNGESDVVCGGRIYPDHPPSRNRMLRWKYGIKQESRPAEFRAKNPFKSFMTNNFIINRKVLEKIPFDERLTGYGHEDTLLGFQLKQAGIHVHHISNPVLNGGLEDNAEFLKKTEDGIQNLVRILSYLNNDPGFTDDVKLLRVYKKLSEFRLTGIVNMVFVLTRRLLRCMLTKGIVNLKLFGFYKLGMLLRNYRK